MSKLSKIFRLLLVSYISLFLYHFLNSNNYFKLHQIKLDRSFTQWGFEFFMLLNITKYFFLLLGLVAIIYLILIIFKEKTNARRTT